MLYLIMGNSLADYRAAIGLFNRSRLHSVVHDSRVLGGILMLLLLTLLYIGTYLLPNVHLKFHISLILWAVTSILSMRVCRIKPKQMNQFIKSLYRYVIGNEHTLKFFFAILILLEHINTCLSHTMIG